MTVRAKTRYGEMDCLAGDSIVSRSLLLYGEWAQAEMDLLAKLVSPGDRVLDVGAFLGTHTLALAHMVGSAGQVHSFEPRHAIRAILQSNVRLNGLSQVSVYPYALGEIAKQVDIPALDINVPQNFGGLAIEPADAGVVNGVETINIVPLDDIALERIDLMKIDAEGMESEVVSGATNTIRKLRPLLFAECNDLQHGSALMMNCWDLDYKVYGSLSYAFNPANFLSEQEDIFAGASEVTLLAIPVEKVDDLLGRCDFVDLACIESLDALSLLLLHKQQYVDEVLLQASSAETLGLAFRTPLTRKLEAELDEQIWFAKSVQARLESTLVNIASLEQALEQALDRERQQASEFEQARNQLLRYRSSSIAWRWSQLLTSLGFKRL